MTVSQELLDKWDVYVNDEGAMWCDVAGCGDESQFMDTVPGRRVTFGDVKGALMVHIQRFHQADIK